jgi:divalent metal cation (Fe/Co/Zn/Cd) transporter
VTEALSLERRRALHRRALWLEYFTVGWNVIEGVVAIGAGIIAGSVALVADAAETWVCSYLSLALLAGVGLHELFGWWWADPVGALAMLPVILWQGWETLGEARERDDDEDLGVAGHGP